MKTAVIGGSGYAGGELLRLLAVHPFFHVINVSAHTNAGEAITSVHPHLQSYAGRTFDTVESIDFSAIELCFLALPHGESAALIAKIPTDVKIVDLGADFRLEDSSKWEKYYGGNHAGAWVYGLPELCEGQREAISKETRVANPGCYATSISLGVAPAVEIIDVSDIVVVAASGTTGAGRNAKINLIGSEVMGSLTSYKFGGVHQHTPEIEQALAALSGKNVKISFTPILAPMPRGILSTITAKLIAPLTTESAHAVFSKAYENEYFVDVLPLGQMPKTAALTGSNKVQIQVAVDEHTNRLIISVAIDNLGKGAAGQAIQNANLICGLHEGAGLSADGLGA
ncbi:MAG: N-acetyl-gamma-glutamyl-phosphate reductase [Actinobacteria bacterium]|uniref:N-acetyl-gamma-glutamyl-phosphate reductase n=1 Tax=freshwater metagenome TaxID=449393 RepID=A0A6J7VF46_9ZZZZ|nr:N-acetyl-gamma-glutamyl-phosphate reductase [Actinomycetota bacterium]MSY36245.1 N-acetyl-gamma-glutamyl-phosphate reductase [Actinomycetota bacterium]MTA72634.1 N-acetyl-gamma-glutamyl-phosphate reductase [Actinomycetota bacterium]MTB30026.1 N-acetyl-gamma-glutamyl-phosphate reductase [Actinomycetota bacterium]MUH49148.1 N-acetyl-gamma-glutamyl-phosphate reductase [Actinomycetota bacterium]